MAKVPKSAAILPPAATKAPRAIDRFTVVDDGGHVEVLLDGESVIADGGGAKAEAVRALGQLIEQEKAGQSARLTNLIATGRELLRCAAIPDDWAAPFAKALADAEGRS